MAKTTLEKANLFRELHFGPDPFVIPNPWSVGTTRILAELGFKALATTSAGLAFSLGARDGTGEIDAERSLEHAKTIVDATDLPVSADLENGFGDSPDIVHETILRAGEIGLVGASIEDFTLDADAPLYDFDLAVKRIETAVAAARSFSFPFMLTARTEGFIRGRPDLDATIKRLLAFEQAGADVLYAPGLPDIESVRTVCRAVTKPVNFVVGVSGVSVSMSELRDAGVRRISTGSSLVRAALRGFVSAAKEISDDNSFAYASDQDTVGDWNRYFG